MRPDPHYRYSHTEVRPPTRTYTVEIDPTTPQAPWIVVEHWTAGRPLRDVLKHHVNKGLAMIHRNKRERAEALWCRTAVYRPVPAGPAVPSP